jgi:hypothetical protein
MNKKKSKSLTRKIQNQEQSKKKEAISTPIMNKQIINKKK